MSQDRCTVQESIETNDKEGKRETSSPLKATWKKELHRELLLFYTLCKLLLKWSTTNVYNLYVNIFF